MIFVVFSLVLFLRGDFLLFEGDTAWIIRTGEYIIDTGTIPAHDLYSYTYPADLPWVVYQWGFEVLIGGAYKVAGFQGAVWVCSIIIATTLLLFFKLLRAMGANLLLAFSLTLFAGTVAAYDWDVRPGIVSQLLFIATLFTLQEYKLAKDIRVLYRLPLIFLIWANSHLGFVVGLVAIAFTILERYLYYISEKDVSSKAQERRAIVHLANFLGISLLVTLLNPNGYRLIPYLFRVMSLEQNDYILELQSPNFHHGFISYELMLTILIASLAFFKRKAELGMLFMTLLFLIVSLHAHRFSPFFAFLSSIVIAQQLNLSMAPDTRRSQPLQTIIEKLYRISLKLDESEKVFCSWKPSLAVAIIMTLMVVSGYTSRMVNLGFSKERFPIEACNFVKQHELPGNLYSDSLWGSYAIYSLYPRYKVFFDTRHDMYGDKIFFEVLACNTGKYEYLDKHFNVHLEDPNAVLDKYQVNWILIEKKVPLSTVLKKDNRWTNIYSDEIALIFLRNNEANRVWLQEKLGVSPETSGCGACQDASPAG